MIIKPPKQALTLNLSLGVAKKCGSIFGHSFFKFIFNFSLIKTVVFLDILDIVVATTQCI